MREEGAGKEILMTEEVIRRGICSYASSVYSSAVACR